MCVVGSRSPSRRVECEDNYRQFFPFSNTDYSHLLLGSFRQRNGVYDKAAHLGFRTAGKSSVGIFITPGRFEALNIQTVTFQQKSYEQASSQDNRAAYVIFDRLVKGRKGFSVPKLHDTIFYEKTHEVSTIKISTC